MNRAGELTIQPQSAPAYRVYREFVLNYFNGMTLGCLKLELPDGMTRTVGTPGADISAHLRIVNPVFFKKCVLHGDIGFGEAFVDGDWESDDVTKLCEWFLLNVESSVVLSGSRRKLFGANLLKIGNRVLHLLRRNSIRVSRRNIREHYDLSNDFYRLFLDATMTYSCARFEHPDQPLGEAQQAKYDALCRKLMLKPTDHVLEIGSGWGGFSLHAVKTYGCRVTTVTISEAQFKYAKALFERENVTDRIDIKLLDYRLIEGRFDKIASIEMLEAVGDEYLETYFSLCDKVLKRDGLIGLQMITCPDSRHASLKKNVDWIQKHIFPGSLLLSVGRVNEAVNRTSDLFLHNLEDMGNFYVETLARWRRAFWDKIEQVRGLGFDERFVRKWHYYLCYCEAAFAMRNISVVQAVYTRPNNRTLAVR